MLKQSFIKHIPNLFTLGNLFLGCLGIIFTFNDHIFPLQVNELDEGGKNVSIIFGFNNRLYLSSFMIFGAVVLDFLDGFSARILKVQSPVGAQLDSLADMITFGLLPACIYYQLLNAAFQLRPNALFIPELYMMPAFLIAICAALRLARFNVDERQEIEFLGLATPACALFTAALPLIIFTNAFNLSVIILNPWLLYTLIIIFSWLMVSNIPMFSLKVKSYTWRGNEVRIIYLLISIIMIIVFKYAGLAASIVFYILTCIVQYFFTKKPGMKYF
ncbi:MAG: CDP-alcohol phosphatidyltransferase family protein [Chitinophagales bacterium]|nr:CDP-alcohol phosphatidyltransferase family protein [Chitinophagales bacterium]